MGSNMFKRLAHSVAVVIVRFITIKNISSPFKHKILNVYVLLSDESLVTQLWKTNRLIKVLKMFKLR